MGYLPGKHGIYMYKYLTTGIACGMCTPDNQEIMGRCVHRIFLRGGQDSINITTGAGFWRGSGRDITPFTPPLYAIDLGYPVYT